MSKIEPSKIDLEACILLMEALHLVNTNVAQFWFNPIKECLDYFALPELTCNICKITKMNFWNYNLSQGWCLSCISKQEKENVISPYCIKGETEK